METMLLKLSVFWKKKLVKKKKILKGNQLIDPIHLGGFGCLAAGLSSNLKKLVYIPSD